jgi:hypothetical protein
MKPAAGNKDQMKDTIHPGAILVKDDTLFPKGLQIEGSPYVSGWRLVNGLEGYGLDRVIRKAGWTFFCVAGAIRTIVFGTDEPSMVRRAIGRILANPRSARFNSLEITQVAAKRFLGLPYISLAAQSRHIQDSLFLFPADHARAPGRTKLIDTRTKAWGITNTKDLTVKVTSGPVGVAASPSR